MQKELIIKYIDNTNERPIDRVLNFDHKQATLFESLFGSFAETPNTARYVESIATQMTNAHAPFNNLVNMAYELIDSNSGILFEEVSSLIKRKRFRIRSLSDLILLNVYNDYDHTSNIFLGKINDIKVYMHDVVWFYNLSFVFMDNRYSVVDINITNTGE